MDLVELKGSIGDHNNGGPTLAEHNNGDPTLAERNNGVVEFNSNPELWWVVRAHWRFDNPPLFYFYYARGKWWIERKRLSSWSYENICEVLDSALNVAIRNTGE